MNNFFYHLHGHPVTHDWLLMQYAAGALPPYESMLMAAWLAVSAAAQQKMRAFEAEGGRMIDDVEPVAVRTDCLSAVMARIDVAPAAATQPRHATAAGIPSCLAQLVAQHCPQQKMVWRQMGDGAAIIDITLCRSEPRHRQLRLVKMAPRQSTPTHRHGGVELTLVLDGSFRDGAARYAAGDLVIISDTAAPHGPQAEDDGCTCLMLTDAPLRFANPLMRIMALLRRF